MKAFTTVITRATKSKNCYAFLKVYFTLISQISH